jgi:RimJ/RimL family protein N-acetyltransferase
MPMTTSCATSVNRPSLRKHQKAPAPATDWRTSLPQLRIEGATLRQLQRSDAPALAAALAAEQVARFISPPPKTVEGFERFIAWTEHEQAAGRYLCFGIVPTGATQVVGIIQVRQLDPSFGVAEWGFALGAEHWGTGLFQAAARQVIDFAFAHVGVYRLEARAMVANGRGNGALRKLGAMPEGVLRRSFLKDGEYVDQMLWGIVASEWRSGAAPLRVH